MKLLWLSVLYLGLAGALWAEEPLSSNAALKQLYQDYDPVKSEAVWVCTKGQENEGWPCDKEYARVAVSVNLLAQASEGDVLRTYLVTSGKPSEAPGGFECHMCSPSIGVAVFAWDGKAWTLESANAAVGFYGSNGDAPNSELTLIGPKKHGVMLWTGDLAQGYAMSAKILLAPIGKTVKQVWWIRDEQDNAGAVDPGDKFADHTLYRADAAFKFTWNDDMPDGEEYYDINVMSRGKDEKGKANWDKVYRFREGQYRLLRTIPYVEASGPQKKSVPPLSTKSK